MELSEREITFLRGNILGMIQSQGGQMPYDTLQRRVRPNCIAKQSWKDAYNGLIEDGILVEVKVPSIRFVDKKVIVVKVIKSDLPVYPVRPWADRNKQEL
jgi:hypothetical protein